MKKQTNKNKNRVVIEVRGGCVQCVFADQENTEVILVDYDDADENPDREEELEKETADLTNKMHCVL